MKKSILLLHGWNYRNYTKMTNEKRAWHNREKLLNILQKEYQIYELNFPGFCSEPEPKTKEWNLNDYANYVEDFIKNNNLKIDYILGYSFGGAVAIRWKTKYQKSSKLILISPAIIRNARNNKSFTKTPKIFNSLRKFLRNIYVSYILKTNEMRYGTAFLRNSYQLIVREDLTNELKNIQVKDYLIIYGSDDDQVNPQKVNNSLNDKQQSSIIFIPQGGHDIANSHPEEILKNIKKFTN